MTHDAAAERHLAASLERVFPQIDGASHGLHRARDMPLPQTHAPQEEIALVEAQL